MNKCTCQNTILHRDVVQKVKKEMLKENTFNDMAAFFKIFGDKTRLKIIHALMSEKMCVCDIASTLNMSHSAVSHQLIVLKEFNIVSFVKVGKAVYYELCDDHINKIFFEGWEHINE